MTEPIAILIGGVPGAGKTSIAVKLANELGIKEVLDTDNLREVVRMFSDNKILHSVTHDCWKFFGEKNEENIIKGLIEHVNLVQPAVLRVLNYNLRRNTSIIIEGAHITPDIIAKINFPIFYFQLAIPDEFAHIERLKSKKCCGVCWQQNFSAIRKIQEWLNQLCLKSSLPIIENSDINETVERIVSHIYDVNRLRLRS
jgi:2-phosphoglycerate kinase